MDPSNTVSAPKSDQELFADLIYNYFAYMPVKGSLQGKIFALVEAFKRFIAQSPSHKYLLCEHEFYDKKIDKYKSLREVVQIFTDTEAKIRHLNLKKPDKELLDFSKKFFADPEFVDLNEKVGSIFSAILQNHTFWKVVADPANWKLKLVYYPEQSASTLHNAGLIRTGYAMVLYQSNKDLHIFDANQKLVPVQHPNTCVPFIAGLKLQYLSDRGIVAPNYVVSGSEHSANQGRISVYFENLFLKGWYKKEFAETTFPLGYHYGWDKSKLEQKYLLI